MGISAFMKWEGWVRGQVWGQGSNYKSLGCQEGHQRHPYPPSTGWIIGGHGHMTHD